MALQPREQILARLREQIALSPRARPLSRGAFALRPVSEGGCRPDLAEQRCRAGPLADAQQICGEAIDLAAGAQSRGGVGRQHGVRGDRTRAPVTGITASGPATMPITSCGSRRRPAGFRGPSSTRWTATLLDELEGQELGWRRQADDLRAQLVQPGLDPIRLRPSRRR
jgi:hypothetical protein